MNIKWAIHIKEKIKARWEFFEQEYLLENIKSFHFVKMGNFLYAFYIHLFRN